MALFIIPHSEVNNPDYRECLICLKWISLLGTVDEKDIVRNHNACPVAKGLCTCWMGDYRLEYMVLANPSTEDNMRYVTQDIRDKFGPRSK